MKQNNLSAPFGLIFEENILDDDIEFNYFYDEVADITFVQDESGKSVPFVEHSIALATDTVTRIAAEPTDQDQDPNAKSFLATDTLHTKADGDPTDTDPGDDRTSYLPMFSTDTYTASGKEATDND